MDMEQKHQPETREDCETLRELIPAYSLGMTDPDETRLVERLLLRCPDVAPELAEYTQMADAVLLSIPQVEPPSHLRQALLRSIRAETAADPPPATAPRWFDALIRPFIPSQRLLPAAAALSMLLALVIAVYALLTVDNLRQDQRTLAAQLQNRDALLSLLGTDDLFTFDLTAPQAEADSAPSGIILCNPDQTLVVVQVRDFPALPAGMAYQVWLTHDEVRISGGVFNVDSGGAGTLIFNAPEPMSRFEYMGITLEPETGSDSPTSPPLVRGQLY